MKRKLLIALMIGFAMASLYACGNYNQADRKEEISVSPLEDNQPNGEEQGKEVTDAEDTDTKEQENAGANQGEKEQKVLIYYGNDNADAIIYKEVTITQLSPETLIDELAKVNIVSMDTKAISVSVDEKDSKLMYLDMSKEFGEYVSMMGTAGEYIVIGGVVDTFLDAYGCEKIIITVEGKTLETGHTSYEGALQFYETYKADE